jgi:hypothetical protein
MASPDDDHDLPPCTEDDYFPPSRRDVPFDEEVAPRRGLQRGTGLPLEELKARQRRLAEDFDRRARSAS